MDDVAAARVAAHDGVLPPLSAARLIDGAPQKAARAGAGAKAAGTGVEALATAPKRSRLFASARRSVLVALLGVSLLGGAGAYLSSSPGPSPQSALQVRVMQMHAKADSTSAIGKFDTAPITKLAGMTDAELAQSVTRAELTAGVEVEQRIDVHGGVVVIPAGARITARLDSYGLRISSSPALSYERDWKLDAQIESVTYRFDEGRLDVDASGIGPDALYSNAATKKANEALLPLLPAELKTPGFDPHDVGHIQLLHRTLASFVGSDVAGSRAVAGAAQDDLGDEIAKVVTSWSAAIVLEPVKEIRGELQDGVTLTMQKGAPLEVRVDANMQGGHPIVERIDVVAMRGDGPVVQRGDSKLQSLQLRSLSLLRNADATTPDSAFRVHADYALEAEHSIKGVIALFGALVGAARGTSPEVGAAAAVQRAGDVKLTGARKQVDEGFQKLSTPVAKLLSQLHVAAPGIGLDRII